MGTETEIRPTSEKILRNSLWTGLEALIEAGVFFGTSVAVGRHFGPEKLGYFTYINLFVSIITNTTSTGLTSATKKYMTEYLALDRPGMARAVYELAHRYQLIGAIVITSIGLLGIGFFGDPHYKLMASILIFSLIPGVMSRVPAEANLAFQDSSYNTVSAMGYVFSYAAVILLTIMFQWDLVGVASATLVGRVVELTLRTISLHARMGELPLETLPRDLIVRIRRFCVEAIGNQILIIVVWDRSELFFLRMFCSLEQIAYYSVTYGFVKNLLQIARVLTGSSGVSLMVECQRDPRRVDSIMNNTYRFLLFVLLPINFGAAALSHQAIQITYGAKYAAAAPVLVFIALLAVPQVFGDLPILLLRAGDRQRIVLYIIIAIGAINVALDLLLIPRFGAVGAAWGNGLAQVLGAIILWRQARRFFTFHFPTVAALRLVFAASVMAVAATLIGRAIAGLAGLIVSIAMSVPLYVFMVKITNGLQASDRNRLEAIGRKMPGPIRRTYLAVITFVTPAAI